ncbi:unnamed protein product [Cochlearia groenlandica]
MVGRIKARQILNMTCIFYVVFVLFVFSVDVCGDVDIHRALPPEAKTTTVLLSKVKQYSQNYLTKVTKTFGLGHSYFFPPNVDFGGKDDAAMGTGQKVKEAAAKSFEKSKETVEEVARSAAEVASDTAEAVKEKAKKKSVYGEESQKKQREGSGEL